MATPVSQDALDALEDLVDALHRSAAQNYGRDSVWSYSDILEWLERNIQHIKEEMSMDSMRKALT